MRVIALKAWSNGSYSMEEKQIADLPDALAETLIKGGIVAPTALPAITDADDGKVLTADSGVWVAQTPASGGGVLVVNVTEEEIAQGTKYTLDKTWQEIADADFTVIKNNSDHGAMYEYIHFVEFDGGLYLVITLSEIEFRSDSASSYPYYVDGK